MKIPNFDLDFDPLPGVIRLPYWYTWYTSAYGLGCDIDLGDLDDDLETIRVQTGLEIWHKCNNDAKYHV